MLTPISSSNTPHESPPRLPMHTRRHLTDTSHHSPPSVRYDPSLRYFRFEPNPPLILLPFRFSSPTPSPVRPRPPAAVDCCIICCCCIPSLSIRVRIATSAEFELPSPPNTNYHVGAGGHIRPCPPPVVDCCIPSLFQAK